MTRKQVLEKQRKDDMPRYIGEKPHEMYYKEADKWYFAGSNYGYNTLKDAKESYNKNCPKGYIDALDFLIIVVFFIGVGMEIFLK